MRCLVNTKILQVSFSSYEDIRFGIKLGQKNIGFNGKFYTIPYFCVFLLKRFLHEDFVLMTNRSKFKFCNGIKTK